VLNEIVAAESGAVVKTIGDAVMATFETPERAVAAALRMRGAMGKLSLQHGEQHAQLHAARTCCSRSGSTRARA
jgi:class 3 adenylate cyclase